MTELIQLVDKDIKRDTITIFHTIKKLEERFNVLTRNMEDVTKIQAKLLKLRTTVPDMKTKTKTENNGWIDSKLDTAEEEIVNIEYRFIKIIQNITKIEIGFKKY